MSKEIFETIIKSVTSVISLFILTRIMGKKQISQLTFFDYVAGISIGSIAGNFAIDSTINYKKGLVSLLVYSLFPIILSFVSIKSYFFRNLLDGTPTVLIKNGEIIEKWLKKTRLNIDELLEECRLKDVFDISDIEFAILETNGKLSIQKKSNFQNVTLNDLNINVQYKDICINLIIDGKILYDNLNLIQKDVLWLREILKSQNSLDYTNVILAYLDGSKKFKIYRKNVLN